MKLKYTGSKSGKEIKSLTVGIEYETKPVKHPFFQNAIYIWDNFGERSIISKNYYYFE